MATSSAASSTAKSRIPFYRNVKTIGVLAQVVFLVVIVVGAYVIYQNVTSALQQANIPGGFGFLDDRAGIPIAETPIRYSGENSYGRAFVIGVMNTLKVALVGVLVASVLGVVIGVMRLSRNFLLRSAASIYVETLRNTPLAVQIVFWYTAVLTPLPPRVLNAAQLPGGVFLSNQGIALPWAYPSYHAPAWWPWVGLALVAGLATWVLRRRALRLADRPGNAFLPGVAVFVALALVSYLAVGRGALPQGAETTFREVSGVVTAFLDEDGNGERDVAEPYLPYAPLEATLEAGFLEVQTQDLSESRTVRYGRFYFPPFREAEFERVEVAFADPEAAAERDLKIHFVDYPSRGIVYRDLDGNDAYDRGEEMDPDAARPSGYRARIHLVAEGFQRTLVADRNGEARLPRFEAEAPGEAAASAGANVSPAQLFAPPAAAAPDTPELGLVVRLRESRPLVWSVPTIPVSTYVGGARLSTNYLALLLALVVYTASFIAEIVRGGLQAVPKGQREAAMALGLSGNQTFRFVVFPQALRIILPPMISQYLNLTKNSSLAPLAAYAELFTISIIIANQTGATVPVTIMIIVAYLLVSLAFAFVLNIVNARLALVER